MAGATIAPSLPQIKAQFSEVSNIQMLVGLLLTLPAVFISVGSLVVGRVIDRTGRLRVLYFGLVLYAVGGTSGLYLNGIYMLLAGRAVLGIAVAMIMTVAVTLIGDYYQGPERQKLLGLQGVFMALGGVLYVGLGGLLADQGWRLPFALYGFSLLVLILAVINLKEPLAHQVESQTSFRFPGIHYLIFFTGFLAMIVFYIVPVQVPFLVKQLGIERNILSGLAIACTTIGSVVSSANYGRVRSNLSEPLILAIAFALIAVGYFLTGSVIGFTVLALTMLTTGVGLGLLMPNLNAWIVEISKPEQRGTAVGLMSSALFMGQFMSPLITNPVKEVVGIFSTFQWMASLAGMLALCFALFHGKLKRT